MRRPGIRVEVDASDDRMQKKIRNAQKQKVPFMLIAGADDMAAGAVSFRYRNGTQKNGVPIAEAVKEIVAVVRERLVEPHALNAVVAGGGRAAALVGGRAVTERRPGPGRGAAGSALHAAAVVDAHRMAYISGDAKPADGECPFCRIPAMPDDEGLIVARGDQVFAVLNLYPYNAGHVLVVPYRHVADYTELDDAETAELAAMTKSVRGGTCGGPAVRRASTWASTSALPPAPASRPTCTSTSCRGGAATPTSCR